jgi:hypothetical protein
LTVGGRKLATLSAILRVQFVSSAKKYINIIILPTTKMEPPSVLLELEHIVVRLVDLPLMLASQRKEDRKYANYALQIVMPKLHALCGDDRLGLSDIEEELFEFIELYNSALRTRNYEKANKLARDFIITIIYEKQNQPY